MDTEKLLDIAIRLKVDKIARVVLEDQRFPLWAGASKPHQHHYGKGGLAKHTLEVCELCLLNNTYLASIGKGVDERQLFLAALFHDSGKMWDYLPVDNDYIDWKGGDHKRKIHHISRSGLVWNDAVRTTGMFTESIDEVYHAILSHHGQREWGSPISPTTRLAWILHLCDNISARTEDCVKWDRYG